MIQVVPLAHALADARKDGISAVLGCDVVNEFLNENCFPYACASEKARLASLYERRHQVNRFYSRLKNFRLRTLPHECRRFAVNRKPLCLS